jgi:lipopolysaccharide/colanic/teichoic acid biosynthesis glycosyltransferase
LVLDTHSIDRSRRTGRHLAIVRDEPVRREPRRSARRAVNVLAAVLGVLLGAPLLLFIGLAVRLTSRGPVLERQIRVGIDRRTEGSGYWRRSIDYGGRLFTMYSFRTRRVGDREAAAEARLTAVGGFLERTGLDALPQLFNVLRGEMNVVGPRPAPPNTFVELRHRMRRYSERQRVLPGIIGFGETELLSDTDGSVTEQQLRRELHYAKSQSALADLRIMARAMVDLLRGRPRLR